MAAVVASATEGAESSGGNMVSLVASGVVLWSTAFVLVRGLFPKRSYDFCNRAVSTMHAVAAVCLACLSVDDWACPVCPLAAASTPRQMKALAVTLSYMVYDAACCHLHGDVRLDNTVHHLVSIVGIGAGLAYQRVRNRTLRASVIKTRQPEVRDGDGGKPAHHGDLEPAASPPGDAQGVRRQGHGPQPPRRRALCRHLLGGADGRGAVPHLRHRHRGQPAPHQGNGDGAATGERLLVPADPQDGQVQTRQEEAASAAGQGQLISGDCDGRRSTGEWHLGPNRALRTELN